MKKSHQLVSFAFSLPLALVAGGCASSPEPATEAPPMVSAALALSAIDWDAHVLQEPPHVRVLPLDENGEHVRTRVAVIRERASSSVTHSGPVVVHGSTSGPATLTLTTDDGRIAWRTIPAGETEPMAVALEHEGGFLEVELLRAEDTRIAVFLDGVRLHDYTLRPGKRATFVVPVGDVTFGLTGPDATSQTKSFKKGQRRFVQLD